MKNVVEDLVAREFENLKHSVQGFCGCDQCRDDVMVYALNRLPPRYVAQRTGQVVTDLAMSSDQERARLTVVLMEAFQVVQRQPRDGHA